MLKVNKTTSHFIPDRHLILAWPADKAVDEQTSLCRITPRDKNLIRDLRHVMQENQTQFWRRFGVTQTQGSRFERGRSVPLPVLLLIRLYLLHLIDDGDLRQVGSASFDSEGPA